MIDKSRVSTEGLLKIGELAKQTDTSISTLKYYIREGLIRPVVKTGRNMSWYDPSCIETINMIRMLQKERYYPLNVIRDLLQTETLRRPPEMALLDAIHKVDETTSPKTITASEAMQLSGLDDEQISALAQAGIISSFRKKRGASYTEEDLTIMQLVRRRLDAGIPLEQSVAAFRTYDRALRNAAHDDINLFVDLIMQPDFTAQAGTHMIRVSDQTLDEFVALRRKEYNRSYGKAYVERLYRFMMQCTDAMSDLGRILDKHGFDKASLVCRNAAAGSLPEDEKSADYVSMFLGSEAGQKSDLITRIIACQKSREFFSSAHSQQLIAEMSSEGAHEMALLAGSLRCLWLTMAPETLGCEDSAEDAKKELTSLLNETSPEKCSMILQDILSLA